MTRMIHKTNWLEELLLRLRDWWRGFFIIGIASGTGIMFGPLINHPPLGPIDVWAIDPPRGPMPPRRPWENLFTS
jgi:hypothetical protein